MQERKGFHAGIITFTSVNVFLDLGLRQPRLEGDEYLSIVDEFMEASYSRWPKAIVQVNFLQWLCVVYDQLIMFMLLTFSIQFEDFQMKWAFETLERYRRKFCMFNDDVQVILPFILSF